MLEQIKAIVDGIAPPVQRPDDFEVWSWSGGNVDDAYQMGFDDGERRLAEQIREALKGS